MTAVGELARVGEVAERLGVSTRTIKYYEELGLVAPDARSAGGFRLYGEESIARLERILRMKQIGYSLSAIRELTSVRETAKEADKLTVLKTAKEHLQERERQMGARLAQMREDLRRAEALHGELRRDIALCEKRLEELKGG